MRTTNHRLTFRLLCILLIGMIGQGCVAPSQRTFASPDDAVQTLVDALRAHDRSQLNQLFGPDADDLLLSGDDVADRQAGDNFVEAFDQKHLLVLSDDDGASLVVGEQEWPLPIPLVKDPVSGRWKFDTAAGLDEINNRRIGSNELHVIKVCEAIVDAQIEYAQVDPNKDGLPEYAVKFISDPGKTNGLYWESADGAMPSPLGSLVADAAAEGYGTDRFRRGEPQPYHGYHYRILTAQGEHAPGGAMDYMVNGKLIGGFAIVAWPSAYGNSGIMTFIVNHEGTVYQRDLGENTDDIARTMTTYNPGPEWKKAE